MTPVNDPPVAIAQSVATNEDTTLGITLTGSDIDGDILNTFNVTVQPLHGTLTGTGANRTYTPNANYHGPDTLQLQGQRRLAPLRHRRNGLHHGRSLQRRTGGSG